MLFAWAQPDEAELIEDQHCQKQSAFSLAWLTNRDTARPPPFTYINKRSYMLPENMAPSNLSAVTENEKHFKYISHEPIVFEL